MTYYEKYKDEIDNIAIDNIAYNPETKSIMPCTPQVCKYCMFSDMDDYSLCKSRLREWLHSEVKEKYFTCEEKDWAGLNDKIPYYARNKDGELYGYTAKPYKSEECDTWLDDGSFFIMLISDFTSLSFSAIQWEDSEPTSRDEILNS